ncbi:TRM11 family SAM-dependent methyltransferase [Bacillus suaedaesalsae]|uniref:RNA methyltransferase n=1 Tax=Bacillus suaedaesalsae TaxID=2810349 RepID=A0ABS2DM95_9BACI|nr:RNA methyltransferase [Bacillus suaedaesalsae]MBM6619531.1 RNA methyltransferase [Bacillus suaedaesalsae]
MNNELQKEQKYIYTYACRVEERSLCDLELRTIFQEQPQTTTFVSYIPFDVSRSPFIRESIDVLVEASSFNELLEKVTFIPLSTKSFKTIYVRHDELLDQIDLKERRRIEREVGMNIPGEVHMETPEQYYGIINFGEKWYVGQYHKNDAVWLKHQNKPNSYSTALNTRVARAVVNIAVPHNTNEKVIDPCCGIGTVLVEGLSMGINIIGSDRNPLILQGTRENIAHFGYETEVLYRDIRDVVNQYDVAIIDMPYNLCSVISPQEQLEMLSCAREFTKRIVIITIEDIDSIIRDAGFTIIDRCFVKKGRLDRQIIVCK